VENNSELARRCCRRAALTAGNSGRGRAADSSGTGDVPGCAPGWSGGAADRQRGPGGANLRRRAGRDSRLPARFPGGSAIRRRLHVGVGADGRGDGPPGRSADDQPERSADRGPRADVAGTLPRDHDWRGGRAEPQPGPHGSLRPRGRAARGPPGVRSPVSGRRPVSSGPAYSSARRWTTPRTLRPTWTRRCSPGSPGT
jgi:hypothetical protein